MSVQQYSECVCGVMPTALEVCWLLPSLNQSESLGESEQTQTHPEERHTHTVAGLHDAQGKGTTTNGSGSGEPTHAGCGGADTGECNVF